MPAASRRQDEQTTAPEPQAGILGHGGDSCHKGRRSAISISVIDGRNGVFTAGLQLLDDLDQLPPDDDQMVVGPPFAPDGIVFAVHAGEYPTPCLTAAHVVQVGAEPVRELLAADLAQIAYQRPARDQRRHPQVLVAEAPPQADQMVDETLLRVWEQTAEASVAARRAKRLSSRFARRRLGDPLGMDRRTRANPFRRVSSYSPALYELFRLPARRPLRDATSTPAGV